jgi:hypothetical protein
MHDKPSLMLIRLLNEQSVWMEVLRRLGVPDDVRHRICRTLAEARLTGPRPADADAPGPEYGWHDGRWIRSDYAQELPQDTTMPSVSETFGSGKSLKAEDIPDEGQVFTISDVEVKHFDDGTKFLVRFEETDKALVANMINTRTIAGLYGDESDDWIGHRITLYPTETAFNGKMVPCIRVRSKPPKQQPRAAARDPRAAPAAQPTRRQPTPMTQAEADGSDDDDIPF